MTKLTALLREERLSKGLSLRDMQKLSDGTITGAYVYLIETRDMVPSPKKLRVLSKILKLNFLDLMVLAGHVATSDLKSKE